MMKLHRRTITLLFVVMLLTQFALVDAQTDPESTPPPTPPPPQPLVRDMCGDLDEAECMMLNQVITNYTDIMENTESAYIDFEFVGSFDNGNGDFSFGISGNGPLVRHMQDGAFTGGVDADLELIVSSNVPDFGTWFRMQFVTVDGVTFTRFPFSDWVSAGSLASALASIPVPDLPELPTPVVRIPSEGLQIEVTPEPNADGEASNQPASTFILTGLASFARIPGYITAQSMPDTPDGYKQYRIVADAQMLFRSPLYQVIARQLDTQMLGGLAATIPDLLPEAVLYFTLVVHPDDLTVRTVVIDAYTLFTADIVPEEERANPTLVQQALLNLPQEPIDAELHLSFTLTQVNEMFEIVPPVAVEPVMDVEDIMPQTEGDMSDADMEATENAADETDGE